MSLTVGREARYVQRFGFCFDTDCVSPGWRQCASLAANFIGVAVDDGCDVVLAHAAALESVKVGSGGDGVGAHVGEDEPVADVDLGELGVLEHLVDTVAGGTKDGGGELGELVGGISIGSKI